MIKIIQTIINFKKEGATLPFFIGGNMGKKSITKEVDGITFDSKTEASFYVLLCKLRSENKILDFDLQPCFMLIKPFVNCRKKYRAMTYTLDFRVVYNNLEEEFIDVKGYSASDRTVVKVKLLRSLHNDTKVTLLRPYKKSWYDIETKKEWFT